MASPTPEFIATLAVSVALAGLILRQGTRLDGRIDRMNERVEERLGRLEQGQADLRERMAKLEGLREAITGKRAA